MSRVRDVPEVTVADPLLRADTIDSSGQPINAGILVGDYQTMSEERTMSDDTLAHMEANESKAQKRRKIPDFHQIRHENRTNKRDIFYNQSSWCPFFSSSSDEKAFHSLDPDIDEYTMPSCGERFGKFVQKYITGHALDYTKGFLVTLGMNACGITYPLTAAGGALRGSLPFINSQLLAPVSEKIFSDWSLKIKKPVVVTLGALAAAAAGAGLVYAGFDTAVGEAVQKNKIAQDAAIGLAGFAVAKTFSGLESLCFWNRNKQPIQLSKDEIFNRINRIRIGSSV